MSFWYFPFLSFFVGKTGVGVTFVSDKIAKDVFSVTLNRMLKRRVLVHVPECRVIYFDFKDSLSLNQFPFFTRLANL